MAEKIDVLEGLNMHSPGKVPNEVLRFGSLLSWMIGHSFQRVQTLNPDAKHRFYTQCCLCGGTDEARDHYKPQIDKVTHQPDCGFTEFMGDLNRLSTRGAT